MICIVKLPNLFLRVLPIPSIQWLKYQFHPRHPRTNAGKYYKCKMKIKMMIQTLTNITVLQYGAICGSMLSYIAKNVILLAWMTSIELALANQGSQSAAAERGKQVLVGANETFAVGDHDFTCFSIVPSVIFQVNICKNCMLSMCLGVNNFVQIPKHRIINIYFLTTRIFHLLRGMLCINIFSISGVIYKWF